jgi:hypothetical protein
MADLAYGEAHAMTKDEARFRMVTTCLKACTITETASRWHTTARVL